jgi:photosystem II stability/assembly factor-like uncharacterized protein
LKREGDLVQGCPAGVIPLSSEMMRFVVVFGLVLFTLLSPSLAGAAGRFPASSAVVFDPHESKNVLVRTTFGLLGTRDNGDSWRWICDRAIGAASDEDPHYAVTAKGTILAATNAGLAASRDGGCTFAFVGGPGTWPVKVLALRADGEIVGVMSKGSDNHLVVSKDDAQTFAVAGGPIDSTVALDGLGLAASDPVRLYLSGTRGEDKKTAALFVSYDAGMTWVERKSELVAGESFATIAGVDPKNADRVYLRSGADGHGRLLVTDDAGKTWKKAFDSATPIAGFALSDDAKRVFVGTHDGVSSSPSDPLAFTKGSSIDAQCLGTNGNALWACSTERSGFFVGISRSGGRNFDAKLHLDEIKGPLECAPESSVGKACVQEWSNLRRDLGLPEVGEKPRTDPSGGGPALRGRAQRTGRSRGGFAAFAGILLVGLVGYNVLKRLRR